MRYPINSTNSTDFDAAKIALFREINKIQIVKYDSANHFNLNVKNLLDKQRAVAFNRAISYASPSRSMLQWTKKRQNQNFRGDDTSARPMEMPIRVPTLKHRANETNNKQFHTWTTTFLQCEDLRPYDMIRYHAVRPRRRPLLFSIFKYSFIK